MKKILIRLVKGYLIQLIDDVDAQDVETFKARLKGVIDRL